MAGDLENSLGNKSNHKQRFYSHYFILDKAPLEYGRINTNWFLSD